MSLADEFERLARRWDAGELCSPSMALTEFVAKNRETILAALREYEERRKT